MNISRTFNRFVESRIIDAAKFQFRNSQSAQKSIADRIRNPLQKVKVKVVNPETICKISAMASIT